MDYRNIYDQIIHRAQSRILGGYVETHHIKPKFDSGTDDTHNLVELTAKEHFICHLLLTKIYSSGRLHYKAVHAFSMMMWCNSNNQDRYKANSNIYSKLKSKFSNVMSLAQSGSNNSQFGSKWIYNKTLKISKKCSFADELLEGWELGRVINFDKLDIQECKRVQQKIELDEKIDELRMLYNVYVIHGFSGVVKSGYKFSKPNLVSAFSKYIPEFIPQNGKRRALS